MKLFEYTRTVVQFDFQQSALQSFGANGWELCAVIESLRTAHDGDLNSRWARWAMLYFKRELP